MLEISRGGAIAIAYAVKHPERVTQLVLYGAFATGIKHGGTAEDIEAHRALASLLRLGWGVNNPAFCKTFTCRFIPEATPQHEQWFDELQRVSTSPEHAARLMERDDDLDVRPLLSQVKTPTLVIHCDRDHPLANKEYLFPFAAVVECPIEQIPDAIGDTLVGTVITHDRKFQRTMMACPHIDRLNIGPVPTYQLSWDQPHEGNLFEHLYRQRAFQLAGTSEQRVPGPTAV